MDTVFTFSNEGKSYTIDNSAYDDKTRDNVYFVVQECPKCKKINGPKAENCYKCGNKLSNRSGKIASRVKRNGLGMLLGCIFSGLIQAMLRIRLGGILTWILVGVCIAIGLAIVGKKIVIDKQATEDYIKYIDHLEQAKNTFRKITDQKEIAQYALTKHCFKCGSNTEKDSLFCSKCGSPM